MYKLKKEFYITTVHSISKGIFIKKKLLSTKSINTDVFSKWNINIQNIIDNSETNSYVKGYLNTIAELYTNLGDILKDKNTNLQEKQQKFLKFNEIN